MTLLSVTYREPPKSQQQNQRYFAVGGQLVVVAGATASRSDFTFGLFRPTGRGRAPVGIVVGGLGRFSSSIDIPGHRFFSGIQVGGVGAPAIEGSVAAIVGKKRAVLGDHPGTRNGTKFLLA